MSDQFPNTSREEEIDLGQVFGIFKRGFRSLFKVILRLFVYLRSNFIILAVLAVIGAGIGFGLSKIISQKLKTEVIVSPNLDSKRYLYDAVNELNGMIRSRDTSFFSSLDINMADIEKFEITVEDVVSTSDKEKETDIKYLEVLQEFENNSFTNEIIRNLLMDQNTLEQRITFYYLDADTGPVVSKKLMDQINSNDYYSELVRLSNQNAEARIEQNTEVIEQLDAIIQKYTDGMNAASAQAEGRLVLAEEDEMNIAELFALKTTLMAQSELKKVEILKRKSPLNIINFGMTQPVSKPLFGKSIFLIPFVLIALYIFKDVIRYLNRKSKELLT